MNASLYSGLFAASIAVGATVAIERFGGRTGGLIAAVPSTIIPASLGFWWTANSLQQFQEAVFAVPAGMLANAAFLYSWRACPSLFGGSHHSLLLKVTLASLAVWGVCAALITRTLQADFTPVALLGILCFMVQIVGGMASCWRTSPAPKGAATVSPLVLMARGLLAGLAIAFSVWLASLGNPLLAGMASVFPAMFLTSMVSVWLAQGAAVPMGAVGPMILGSTSVSAYALLASWTLPTYGLALGVGAAWAIAIVGISIPSWAYLRWRALRAPDVTDPSSLVPEKG